MSVRTGMYHFEVSRTAMYRVRYVLVRTSTYCHVLPYTRCTGFQMGHRDPSAKWGVRTYVKYDRYVEYVIRTYQAYRSGLDILFVILIYIFCISENCVAYYIAYICLICKMICQIICKGLFWTYWTYCNMQNMQNMQNNM
jgi:hypothetical protein